jgi:DNA polymerase-3 subunit epsilon
MQPTYFAVVDVETTGGFAGSHRVTEIGIALTDGRQILKTYHTLLQPGMAIPRHITALTGISNQMVAGAPTFAEVADQVDELLADAVFVAHNVNFDYSFIRQEMALIGRDFRRRKLCTARYARSLITDQQGFSLKKLADRFAINNEQPHRALSDALTAAEILHQLLVIDADGLVQKKISALEREVKLPIYMPPEQFHNLPNSPGVYFMYGANGKPLYIGKAKKLKQRIATHFLASGTARTQAFMNHVVNLKTAPMGSELMALLREDVEIRKYWPPHNSAQKQINKAHFIIAYKDQQNVSRLILKSGKAVRGALKVFYGSRDAELWLKEMAVKYNLCLAWLGLPYNPNADEPDITAHNYGIDCLLKDLKEPPVELVLRLTGRHTNERGFVWLRDFSIYALGFAPKEIDWRNPMQLEAHAEQVYSSPTMEQYVATHLRSGLDVDVYKLS